MSGPYLPPSLSRRGTDSVAGGDPVPAPSTSASASAATPSKASRPRVPNMPEGRPDAAQRPPSAAPKQRSAAAALQVALLGRELDWTDQARMRSGTVAQSLHAGLAHQAQQTLGAIGSIVKPVLNFFDSAGDAQKAAASTAAAGVGAAGLLAADSPAAAALAQHWKAGAGQLAPILLPVAALAVVAAAAEYVAPSGPLRELERIGEGPDARSLAELVDRLCDSRPEAVRDAVRPLLLEMLPALERMQHGPHAPAVLDLVEDLLPVAWSNSGAASPSRPFVLASLPALERMAQGPHASQMLSLARELLGPNTERAGREQRQPALLAAFDALAGPHAPAVSELIRELCPPSPKGSHAGDAAALIGLAEIAAGQDAAKVMAFVGAQLDACPEGTASAALLPRLTEMLPVLGMLAHSSADVLVTLQHLMRDHADDSTRGALRLALLQQLPAFAQLFAQSPTDVHSASIAFQDYKLPIGGHRNPVVRRVGAAVSQLAATKPTNQLNQLLGLSTPQKAVEFWLAKAGGLGSSV